MEPVDRLDGESLCPLLAGQAPGWSDTVYSEILCDGALAPLLMVRKGAYKLVLGRPDPPQLFDLGADPDERRNLCDTPSSAEVRGDLEALAGFRWGDGVELERAVRASQRRRRFLMRALRIGAPANWDFSPPNHTERHAMRGGMSYARWAYTSVVPAATRV
jgi:choline-sulfatase